MHGKIALATLALVCGLLVARGEDKSDVIDLTPDNFEHDTQVNSGMTTGPWFVEFYAPWCGHCKRLAPDWEKLATELKGQVNVAKVDAAAYRSLGKQFGVRGFPTLILFRDSKMYNYKGKRSVEDLANFALEGYKDATAEPLPSPPTPVDQALEQLEVLARDFTEMYQLRKLATGLVLLLGLWLGILVGCVCAPRRVEVRTVRRDDDDKPEAKKDK